MSWFGRATSDTPVATISQIELDNKIIEATSESIPNGEIDLSIAFEITDLIRSKKILTKTAMRSLKKRLNLIYLNPNLLLSSLKLIDLCIKNCGFAFLIEISSKEFMDYLIDFIFKIHYNTKELTYDSHRSDGGGNGNGGGDVGDVGNKIKIGQTILSYLQNWKIIFENQQQLQYVEKKYQELKNQGFEFPNKHTNYNDYDDQIIQLNSKFIVDSEVPPDWVDNEECMICYSPFSMLNRKHHCRACGGVFCQNHSSNNIPLVNLGIMEPVRVCDNCFVKYDKSKNHLRNENNLLRSIQNDTYGSRRSRNDQVNVVVDDEEEQIRKAIELSLKESSGTESRLPPPVENTEPETISNDDDDDEDEDAQMKAAIAASLKEYETEKSRYSQYQQPQSTNQPTQPTQPELDLYNISFPTFSSSSNYPQPQFTAPLPPPQNQQQQQQQQISSTGQSVQPQDLSQTEEEQINLFITLMNNIKNDSRKQKDIMYDSNLNELYGKVIKFRPKLNKSLRNSIEKYETFLEMNNKISTITRLYDQFLEQKLNMAYGNHHINTLPLQQQTENQFTGGQQQQQQQLHLPAQGTGYLRYGSDINVPQQQQQAVSPISPNEFYNNLPQHTGFQNYPSYQQNQGPQIDNSYLSQQPSGASTKQQQQQQQQQKQQQQKPPTQTYPTQLQPSEPDFEDDRDENENENESVNTPRFKVSTSSGGTRPVYPTNDFIPDPYNNKLTTSATITTNGEDNYVAVSLPHYPPPEDLNNELPPQQHYVRRASSSLPANAYEDASLKYPTLENVEYDYNKKKKREEEEEEENQNKNQRQQSDKAKIKENDFPDISKVSQFNRHEEGEERKRSSSSENSNKKYVVEPEPLIEL